MANPAGRPPFAPADLSTVFAHEATRTLTFRDWEAQANRLAAALAGRGVRRGDAVAVRVHTRLEWLVINLAIAKLGAIQVAVNYRLTGTEVRPILLDCGVRALVLDDKDPSALLTAITDLHLLVVVSLGGATPDTTAYPDMIASGDPAHRPADDLAQIIIYSSGTTGAPKGIPMTRTSGSPRVMAEYLASVGFGGAIGHAGSRTLVNLPMHHAVGPAFTRLALVTGGQLFLRRHFEAEQTLALIEQHRITHWNAVPTMLRRILNLPAEVRARYDTSSLEFLQIGGAPAGSEFKKRVRGLFGENCLYESYGCSEAGMIAGGTPAEQRAKPGTVGHAYTHVSIRILDDDGRELPAGQTGEITVRTPNMITGYIGQEPFGPDKLDPDGYYHTADIGYLDQDGYLFINDRRSDMIIAGSANIYPSEIEQVLTQHPAVAIAGVIGVPHTDLGEQPEAYVELVDGASVSQDELIAFCEGRLAKYKWPRHVHILDEVPVNTAGKIVKHDLRTRWRQEQGVQAS